MTKNWILQSQECENTYLFNGQLLLTRGVADEVPMDEVFQIIEDVQKRVLEMGGADYLQVFNHIQNDTKIFVIDALNRAMKESGDYDLKEHDYWTIMFNHEY